jgi:hypothetical protein
MFAISDCTISCKVGEGPLMLLVGVTLDGVSKEVIGSSP